ncbi:MAG: hypothetical protein KJ995_07205 [Candidatus Omnitrophica bacterium]|nr:hypothetical protein [Candidatus Omnitrophota bacterium]MBU1128616.1 hypothetical protein [Candidatus Omnitrophota bacterium]MBU1657098.1 hypothetical protein [Candidatus Omnitrophota bacterium]MBU1852171.1 hypothetical protein [Candidatus Omnitrophota bacterium]
MYYVILTIMADQIALPDVIARDLIPVIQRINVLLGVGLPVVFTLISAWAFILSYRFIAPLERLEEDLQKIDDGDYSVRLQIQEDHDLKPVADIINDLVGQLDKMRG